MGKINIFSENSSLLGSLKPGRRAKRGKALTMTDKDRPSIILREMTNIRFKHPNYKGTGTITGK
jgi:hypothetical protein